MKNKRNIIIAITGASGSIYANQLINRIKLSEAFNEIAILQSNNARAIWNEELGENLIIEAPLKNYPSNDFNAPFASGSSNFDTMIVIPCSMGVLGRIANGISDDLITRAADVMLKEERKLILVPRETPFNLIHIRNMEQLILSGATICPANPSFYHKPENIEELADTVVERVCSLANISTPTKRWNQ